MLLFQELRKGLLDTNNFHPQFGSISFQFQSRQDGTVETQKSTMTQSALQEPDWETDARQRSLF